MYLSSQANPNSSSTNLHQLKDARLNRVTGPPPGISSPRPKHFPSPYMSSFGSFSAFQLPLTPPVSNTGSPVREQDSYNFTNSSKSNKLKNGSHSKTSATWLPPIDVKIVVLCLGWYFCSAVSSNSTKSILKSFNYPIILTEVQFLLNCIFCLITLKLTNGNSYILPQGFAPKNQSILSFIQPTSKVLKTTLPMGMFQFVGHLSSHKATSLISVSLVNTVKALSPITTVLTYRLLFSVKYKTITYITLAPLITGIMLACYKPKRGRNASEEYYITGLMYAFISMLIFVSQNIFAKKILTWVEKLSELPVATNPHEQTKQQNSQKLDKLTILYNCSIIGFIFTLPIYMFSEFQNDSISVFHINLNILSIMMLNGVSHFLQSLLAFQILGQISTVNYSIANIMKRIVVIVVAIIWEGQPVSYIQGVGLCLTVIGLYCYDRWGVPSK